MRRKKKRRERRDKQQHRRLRDRGHSPVRGRSSRPSLAQVRRKRRQSGKQRQALEVQPAEVRQGQVRRDNKSLGRRKEVMNMGRKGTDLTNGRSRAYDYRHLNAKRKNNPPAGIAPTYEVRERRTTRYAYDPHLDPQLVWAGKAEHTSFEVDVVSLHIHERISTKAILQAVRRPQPVQPDLFGETPLPADQQIEFYKHEVGWANRLILGDSLLVMNSLLVKEDMARKVQMIYIDPPYGIKYASNFQPRIDRRAVKEKDEDLTHELERIKAYRDTCKLGIHSYLTYLSDRLLLARELLTESGSIFVQINDKNLHLVRYLLDEVFGREKFVAVIPFIATESVFAAKTLHSVCHDLLWYAKNKSAAETWYRIYRPKECRLEILEQGLRRGSSPSPRHLLQKAKRWRIEEGYGWVSPY